MTSSTPAIESSAVRFVVPEWVKPLAERPVTDKLAKKKGLPFAKVWEHMPAAAEALLGTNRYYRWVDREPRADAIGRRVRERLARGEPEATFDQELEAATLAFGLASPMISGGNVDEWLLRPARAFWHWADRAGAPAAMRTLLLALRFAHSDVEKLDGEPHRFSLVMPGDLPAPSIHNRRDVPVLRDALRAFGVDELGGIVREGLDDDVLVAWLTDDRVQAARLYDQCVAEGADLRAVVPIASLLDDATAAARMMAVMWSDDAILRVVLTHGLAVADAVFARVPTDPSMPRRWMPALACYPSLAAARLLVPMLEKKADRKLVGDALAEMPAEAVVALREALAKRPKYRDAIEALIATLGPRAEVAHPTKTELASTEARQVAADAADLPPVLSSPPWRAKKRSKDVVVAGLVAHEVPLRIDLSTVEPEMIAFDRGRAASWRHISAEVIDKLARGGSPRGSELTALSAVELDMLRDRNLFSKVDYQYWQRDAYTPGLYGLLQQEGVAVVPAAIAIASFALPSMSAELAVVGSVHVAPLAVSWLGYKATRKSAEAWAKRFPEHAASGLLPIALGKTGTARDRATHLMRVVDAAGHRTAILDAARAHGAEVERVVAELVARDPLEACPAKPPKLPDGLDALPSVQLRDGRTLPNEARTALLEMLAFSPIDMPYAGIAQVVTVCDARSLDAFAEALVRAWVAGGMISAHEWMVRQVALIGTDVAARFLEARSRAWAQDGSKQRAILALDVLGAMGSDLALSLVGRISRGGQRQYLKDHATEVLARIAEERGLSSDELEDRTAPDLGLDEHGTLTLDFGPRAFQVGFDEHLRPFVRTLGAESARLDALPRAAKTDDPIKAKEAAAAWKDLKAEVERVSSDQIARLERMMSDERRVEAAVFRSAFVLHPLVGHLARRLVWGIYDDSGALVSTFRVIEDRTFTTVDESPFMLPEHALVGVVHPLALAPDQLKAWALQLADYEIVQPFAQLGRPIVDADVAALLERCRGSSAPSGLLYGLRRFGWRISADEAGITGFTRRVGDLSCTLSVEPTLVSGESTKHRLSLATHSNADARAPTPIQISELAFQLDSVVS